MDETVIKQFLFFPTLLSYVKNLNVDHDKVLSELKKLPYKNLGNPNTFIPDIKTGIFISENSNNIFKDLETGPELLKEISKHVEYVIKNYYKYDIGFTIATNWATKTLPKQIGDFHIHANFLLTGCYYPDGTVEEKLNINFKKPQQLLFDPLRIENNEINGGVLDLLVTRGNLIIFPATLEHRIGYNNTDKERYSIAFNVFPKGKISNGDGEFIIK